MLDMRQQYIPGVNDDVGDDECGVGVDGVGEVKLECHKLSKVISTFCSRVAS